MSENDRAIFQWSFLNETMMESELADGRQSTTGQQYIYLGTSETQWISMMTWIGYFMIYIVHVDELTEDDSDISDEDGEMDPDLEREIQTQYFRRWNKDQIKLMNRVDVLKGHPIEGRGRRKSPTDGLKLEYILG